MGLRRWSWGLGEGAGWLWLFPMVGLLMCAIAVVALGYRLKFEADAERAEGTVVDLALSRDSDGSGDTLCPVVSFRTIGGEAIRFVSGTCSRPARYRGGERVRVLYRPGAPERASLARDGSLVVHGESPWCIRAQWQDPATRKLHVFRSDPIWFDPSGFVGETVRVLVDPADPRRYWLDIDFLPERA